MSSGESRRQEVTGQMWYATEDCSRSVQRRLAKLRGGWESGTGNRQLMTRHDSTRHDNDRQKNVEKQEIRSVELGICPMQLLQFWSRDVHPVQNLLLCTKFHENRMIFHWDMAIYRFSKWRPSAILELLYHHTRPHPKSVAGRSCLSNFMSIWYTNLKI